MSNIQKKANIVDDLVTDKGYFMISTKTIKWFVGMILGLSLLILGIAWGFKTQLENKIESELSSTEERIIKKVDIVEGKVDKLESEDIKPNTKKNYEQDGSLRVLFDRVNSRHIINDNYNRPNNTNVEPPSIMVD